jgi:hypothetical protein
MLVWIFLQFIFFTKVLTFPYQSKYYINIAFENPICLAFVNTVYTDSDRLEIAVSSLSDTCKIPVRLASIFHFDEENKNKALLDFPGTTGKLEITSQGFDKIEKEMCIKANFTKSLLRGTDISDYFCTILVNNEIPVLLWIQKKPKGEFVNLPNIFVSPFTVFYNNQESYYRSLFSTKNTVLSTDCMDVNRSEANILQSPYETLYLQIPYSNSISNALPELSPWMILIKQRNKTGRFYHVFEELSPSTVVTAPVLCVSLSVTMRRIGLWNNFCEEGCYLSVLFINKNFDAFYMVQAQEFSTNFSGYSPAFDINETELSAATAES